MSQENVALVASVYDADRDYTTLNDPSGTEAVLEGRRDLYAPQFEFHVVIEGNRLVQRGIDGYLKLMRDWLEPWESYNIAPDGIREIDERIAVLTRHRGRLKGR